MDGAWLIRAGLLAELVSFLLIAPEVIGSERLQRIEVRLRRWLDAYMRFGQELVSGLGSRDVVERSRVALYAALLLPALNLSLLYLLSRYLYQSSIVDKVVFSCIVGLAVWGLLMPLQGRLSNSLLRIGPWVATLPPRANWVVARVLFFAYGLSILLTVLFMLVTLLLSWALTLGMLILVAPISLLTSMIPLARRMLRHPGGLRRIVFRTGLLLLFGGVGAQFAATF